MICDELGVQQQISRDHHTFPMNRLNSPRHRLWKPHENENTYSVSECSGLEYDSAQREGHEILSIACQGFLRKRLALTRKMGKPQFCVLIGNRMLWYASREHAARNFSCRGEVAIVAVKSWDGAGMFHTYKHTFGLIVADGKEFHCSAPSGEEKESWVKAVEDSLLLQQQLSRSSRVATHIPYFNFLGIPITSAGAGAVAGGLIGTIAYPGVGTAIGAAVGAACSLAETARRAHKWRKREYVRAMLGPSYSEDSQKRRSCRECDRKFAMRRRRLCHSCGYSFCRQHCRRKILLPQMGIKTQCRVCDRCFRRQDFINFLFIHTNELLHLASGETLTQLLDTVDGHDVDEANESSRSSLAGGESSLIPAFFSYSGFDGSYVLHSITALFHSRRDPSSFISCLHHFPFHVECHIEEVEMYWPQIIHLVACFPSRVDEAIIQLSYFGRFIQAVCRRSVHIAHQTVWFLRAAYQDMGDYGANQTLALLALLSEMDDNVTSMWEEVLFENAPPHQRSKIVAQAREFVGAMAIVAKADPCKSMQGWLDATTVEEIALARQAIMSLIPSETKNSIIKQGSPPASLTLGEIHVRLGEKVSNRFFEEQTRFIKSITELAELLRFVHPRSARKEVLIEHLQDLKIPAMAYIPLCRSTDPFFRILDVVKDEGTVFSTKARAPTLMLFEVAFVDDTVGDFLRPTTHISEYEDAEQNRSSTESFETASTSINAAQSHRIERSSSLWPVKTICIEPFQPGGVFSQAFESSWAEKKDAVRRRSAHRDVVGWDLISVIAKSNDDMRQEVFAMQLIEMIYKIFKKADAPLWLQPYMIMPTGGNVGLVQTLTDTVSLDKLKKTQGFKNLLSYFEETYGPKGSPSFLDAQECFIQSLAGYSIASYVLLLKDRHNGNILIDVKGHLIHIDYGFLFGDAPGGRFSLEYAPFKLTAEMLDLLGGQLSKEFERYRAYVQLGFEILSRSPADLLTLVEVTATSSPFPCFLKQDSRQVLWDLRQRLFVDQHPSIRAMKVDALIQQSLDNRGTRRYDRFQRRNNGIAH